MESSTRRRPVIQKHRARPTPARDERKGDQMDEEIGNENKKKYMDFIYRLMARMDIESLERMLDAAIDEIR